MPAITKATNPFTLARRGVVVWFTGLSGAGKTTLANALAERGAPADTSSRA